jgi:hypothetical protein
LRAGGGCADPGRCGRSLALLLLAAAVHCCRSCCCHCDRAAAAAAAAATAVLLAQVLVLKTYLKACRLNEVNSGGLSSYSLTNMVIAHLQEELKVRQGGRETVVFIFGGCVCIPFQVI